MTPHLKYRNALFLLGAVLCSLLSYYASLAAIERAPLAIFRSVQLAAAAYAVTVALFSDEPLLSWKHPVLILGALICCGAATSVTVLVMDIPGLRELGFFAAYFAGGTVGAIGFMLCCRLVYRNVRVWEGILLAILSAALAAAAEMLVIGLPRENDMAPLYRIIIPWQILFTLALIVANRRRRTASLM